MKRLVLVVALVLAGVALPAHSADAPPTKKQIAQCVELAKNEYVWKDKESVRSDEARWEGPSDNGSRIMSLAINAKNTYGAYGGAKYAFCLFSKGKAVMIQVGDVPYRQMIEFKQKQMQ